jgi:hypothetical protein
MESGKQIVAGSSAPTTTDPQQYFTGALVAGLIAIVGALFRQTKVNVLAEHVSGLTLEVEKEVGEMTPSNWSIRK